MIDAKSKPHVLILFLELVHERFHQLQIKFEYFNSSADGSRKCKFG
jgi:hypothetical protein